MVREGTGLSLSRACELAGAGRASVYYRPVPADAQTPVLQSLVDRLYMDFPYYGTRGAGWHLRRLGHEVGRDRARSLMAAVNWRTVQPGPRTSNPGAGHAVYPYLLGDMEHIAPGQVICSDITYIPVQGGYLYLVAIMDWSSRFVLSWEPDNTLGAGFCAGALKEALERHGTPEISNTHQGSWFTGEAYLGVLRGAGAGISMDGRGRWIDNRFIERLWRSPEYEAVYLEELEGGRRALAQSTEVATTIPSAR